MKKSKILLFFAGVVLIGIGVYQFRCTMRDKEWIQLQLHRRVGCDISRYINIIGNNLADGNYKLAKSRLENLQYHLANDYEITFNNLLEDENNLK